MMGLSCERSEHDLAAASKPIASPPIAPQGSGAARTSRMGWTTEKGTLLMRQLSEMNGRPPHVRQQQFEKESQYRSMLRDQIEENRKRKEADKAKLDEEKRKELEEIQRLQGIPAPRRQQHAEFQESPDLPMPSPGRLPPAGQTDDGRNYASKGYDQGRGATRAKGAEPGYGPRNAPGGSCIRSGARWQGRQNALEDTRDREEPSQDRAYYEPQQTTADASLSGGYAGRGRSDEDTAVYGRDAPSRDDGRGMAGGGDGAGRPGGQYATALPLAGEDTARKLAFERAGRVAGPGDDFVPRADFDELTKLCRDLLLEQKQLRHKLEEREEREELDARARQELTRERERQKDYPRGRPRRAGAGSKAVGAATAGGDSRRRAPQLPGSSSRVQSNSVRESVLRRDKSKPGVAFGSTVSRLEQPRNVDRPRGMVSRGDRDQRVSKSEPVPRADDFALRHQRHVTSTNGAGSGKLFEPGWANPSKGGTDGRFAVTDRSPGDFARREEDRRDSRSNRTSAEGGGTVHDLLRRGHGPPVSSRGTGASQADAEGGYGELGGESTFLAANALDSGLAEGTLHGRAGAVLDPRNAAGPWGPRR